MAVLCAAAASAMSASQQKKERRDDEGHVLETWWKDYQAAYREDKPQMAEKALVSIKEEASRRHLAWDFYDAGCRYIESVSNRNWKMRDSLNKAFDAEIESFDEPVVTYARSRSAVRASNESFKMAKASEKRLSHACNGQFYKMCGIKDRCYGEFVLNGMQNDWEFVLWDIVSRQSGESFDEACAMLRMQLGDRYPEAALLEFSLLEEDGYEAFAEKYAGRGVSFIALQYLLDRRLYSLSEKQSGQEGYVALRRECVELLSRMNALKGEEKRIAECCDYAEDILKVLDEESVSASASDGELTVCFKNLASAVVTVSSKAGKEVFRKQVSNPVRSYFVTDTVKVILPSIDDGDYVMKVANGKTTYECEYHKYTISLASRSDADAFRIYAADYKTGKPVAKAALVLESSGKELARYEDFVFDGFTEVPAGFVNDVPKGKYSELRCEYRDDAGVLHKSWNCSNNGKSSVYEGVDVQGAALLCDRSAFKPGETVNFKGILFHGNRYEDIEPAGGNVPVKAVLVSPDGVDLSSKDLLTNEFGSVAGSFEIPRNVKNGSFMVELRQGRSTLQSEYVTVDDFVLPSYVISFDSDKRIYLPGDTVLFKGRVESFSGHPVSGAVAEAVVEQNYGGETVLKKKLELAQDGSFELKIESDSLMSYSYYACKVKVVDGTGETAMASTSAVVMERFRLALSLANACEGKSELPENEGYGQVSILGENVALMKFDIGQRDGLAIRYDVLKDGKSVGGGNASPGELKEIVLPEASGLYEIKAVASALNHKGEKVEALSKRFILKVTDADTMLDAPVENVIRKIDGDDVAFMIGAASGEVWAVVEIFDPDGRLCLADKIHLDGRRGEEGSLRSMSYAFNPSWGDAVSLCVFYFRNGKAYRFNASYDNKLPKKSLPLEFERVMDVAHPGALCVVRMKTDPDVECAATVFDKSTEMIRGNVWNPVRLWKYGWSVWYLANNGCDHTEVPVRIRGKAVLASARVANSAVDADGIVVDDDMFMNLEDNANLGVVIRDYVEDVEEEAVPFQLVETKAAFGGTADVEVREDFASTVAFEPFLRSGKDGNIEFSFKAGDKLSTFIVQAFAHDRKFNNGVIRREFKVTLPVKMAVVEPQMLYCGDRYVLMGTVSNNSDSPVEGRVEMEEFGGTSWKGVTPIVSKVIDISVPAGGTVPVECGILVPDVDTLGIKMTFRSSDASTSDAIFVTVPVLKPVQTLTESHSALLRDGADRAKLVSELRGLFVNAPGADASLTEVSILDMVKAAIPDLVRTDRRDLVSVMDALYSGILAHSLKEDVAVPVSELERKLLLCRCDCGGFSWFEGMDASPILTALVLERYHALSRKGLAGEVRTLGAMVRDAVKYLDKSYFSDTSLPWWRGALSLQQYLYVRSLFPEIEFDPSSVNAGALKTFRKDAKAYLIPGKERGMNGEILSKARRCLTLMALSEDGSPLPASWGISTGKLGRFDKSFLADVESLLEYAVPHKSGGFYYPNAVMPWRGLMESELYAHAQLCSLLDDVSGTVADAGISLRASEVAEGLRLWMMVQKETQGWGDDPAFVDALAAVLDGGEGTLATKVIVLKAGFSKPFEEVAATGNGFTVSRTFKRDGVALKDGDTLKVGDRIVAEYSIKNDENRSFVLLSCPRPASLRPVKQLSGRIGWGLWRGAQGYRNVLRDRSEYWYDSYPEENTTVSEEFFVTQKGAFRTPAVSVECLYAPHYRANDAGRGPVVSK